MAVGIVDAHIHLYPPSVYNDPIDWAEAREERYWLDCVAPKSRPSIQGWADIDQLLRDMDEAGVDRAVILGWYWERPTTCHENIAWQMNWIAKHPDRLSAFAPFNANGESDSLDSLRHAFDRGFIGIGELNPPAQQYPYRDEYLQQALALAGSEGKWVNFHVTDPSKGAYPGKIDTPFEALLETARRFSNTKFIFSHLGGMMGLEELAGLENVYLDTAAAPLLYDSSIYQTAAERIGAERILFGSDYPLRTFPKQQRKPDFISHIDQIRNSSLAAEPQALILGENAIRQMPGLQHDGSESS